MELKTATGACPRCGEQLVPTTYGIFCLSCGYTNYGERAKIDKKISSRDMEGKTKWAEEKNTKKKT